MQNKISFDFLISNKWKTIRVEFLWKVDVLTSLQLIYKVANRTRITINHKALPFWNLHRKYSFISNSNSKVRGRLLVGYRHPPTGNLLISGAWIVGSSCAFATFEKCLLDLGWTIKTGVGDPSSTCYSFGRFVKWNEFILGFKKKI